ncbi:MAG: BON domain-containing protein [Lacipirellulaceae bacterium]
MPTATLPAAVAQSKKCALTQQVEGAIRQSPYLSDREIRIQALNGVIKLEGQVNSFFQKQMAQELLRRVDGVQRVDNRLRVER